MRYIFSIVLLITLLPAWLYAQTEASHWQSRSDRNELAEASYELGNIAASQGNFHLALEHYDEALKMKPSSVDFLMTRGQCKELYGDDIGALIDYESAVRIEPKNINAYFKRGWLKYRQKDYKGAVLDFGVVIRNESELGTSAVIFKGIEYNEGGEMEMTGVTTIDKLKSDAYNARALAWSELEDYPAALLDYERALNLNPEDPNYVVNRGLLYKEIGNLKMAENDFKQALNIFPGHKIALYNLSLIIGKEQVNQINQALYASGDFALAFSKRGYERFIAHDFLGALDDYDSALVLRPNYPEDLMNRGLVKVKLGDFSGAIKDYELSLIKKPLLTRNYVHLGNVYQALKQFESAINNYQLYLILEGDDGTVYYNKGVAEFNSKKYKRACVTLTKAWNLGEKKAQKPMARSCKD